MKKLVRCIDEECDQDCHHKQVHTRTDMCLGQCQHSTKTLRYSDTCRPLTEDELVENALEIKGW